MKISGLQKLTLLDYPGHLAAILFLEGCNFRCPFCQNSPLVLPAGSEDVYTGDSQNLPNHTTAGRSDQNPDIPQDEIFSFLKKRAGILEGVCISGGEPAIHRELPDLIRKIRSLGYLIKLDTNGTNPQMLAALLEEKLLDYIAMDIKAGRSNYRTAAGLTNHSDSGALLDAVSHSVSLLMSSSVDYEFRTTVVNGLHTDADFEDIASWIGGCRRYVLQSFRDCDSIIMANHSFTAFSETRMQHFLEIVQRTIPQAVIRGMDN